LQELLKNFLAAAGLPLDPLAKRFLAMMAAASARSDGRSTCVIAVSPLQNHGTGARRCDGDCQERAACCRAGRRYPFRPPRRDRDGLQLIQILIN
jgi:hypothetical protein